MFIHNSRRGIVRSFGKHVQYSNCKCYFIHRSTAWIIWCTFEDFHIKTSFQRLFAGGGGGGGDRESMWNFRLFRFRYLLSWLRYSRHLVFCLSQRFHGTQLYHCRISYLNTWRKYTIVPEVVLSDFIWWALGWEIVIYMYRFLLTLHICIRFEISWLYKQLYNHHSLIKQL